MKKIFCLLLLLLLMMAKGIIAQITIGPGAGVPQEFSVLELLSDTTRLGGLRMPRLTTHERDSITASQPFQIQKDSKALGLTIYNRDTDCMEFWNGEDWISTCVGEVCPAPDIPGEIIFTRSGTGPLRLNETFTAEVTQAGGIIYTWTIPSVFAIIGSQNDNPITLKAITPGIHGLYNIGVTATNDCGSTSSSRAGNGFIEVLNCETEPQPSDIDLSEIVISLQEGSGTASNPYIIRKGSTFTLSYPIGNGLIIYNWHLNTEGSDHFNIISQGNGSIVLTAKKVSENGIPCSGTAIGIVASNDCGDSPRIDSEIYILIEDGTDPCPKPDPPGPITFSKHSMLINDTLTARVTPQPNTTYTWFVPKGLIIVGSNTGRQITIRAITAGTINLSGVSVIATNDCGSISDPTNGTGILVVKDPSLIPLEPGNIRGRTCFDIAKTESGGDTDHCGDPDGRKSNKTDFEKREEQDPVAGTVNPDYSGIQVYTFIPPSPPESVTDVRFSVDDPSGKAVERYGIKSDNTHKLVIYFSAKLNEYLVGVTRKNAWKVYIYAIYTQYGQERSVKLTLSLQDCACCGAKTRDGGWLNFMYHNLGADESLDPFVYSKGLKGHLYQWGRKSDGHELRTSSKVSGIARQSDGELDAQGQVQGRKTGQFIMFVYGRLIVSDWRTPSDNNLWTDNKKATADPCPPGWKVPSSTQWESVKEANDWNWTQNGRMVGEALFLPTAGSRSARPGTSIGSDPESSWPNAPNAYYWSSTGEYNSYWGVYVAHELGFSQAGRPYVGTNNGITYRLWGQSVRCVEDLY